MPKPVPKKEKDASAELLNLNSQAHKALGDFMDQMHVEEDIATIPYASLSSAHDAGMAAANIIGKVKPKAPELDIIKGLTDSLGKILNPELYPVEEGKLKVPAILAFNPNKAEDELDAVKALDTLANKIHDVAMELVGATGELGGCKVAEVLPTEAHAVSKYCAGALLGISVATVTKVPAESVTVSGKKKILKNPQLIMHKLGIHEAHISPLSVNGTAQVAIEYHDSVGYADSKTRLEGVRQRLVKEGFECHKQPGNIIYCWNEIGKDKLTRLATFFSLLFNADVSHMKEDTIPVVSDKAWDIAGKLVQEYGDQTYKSGQGHLNWSTLHHEWLQEKEIFKKQVIYKDLRDLTILRDKHHQLIEEAYHVEAIHAPGFVVEDPEGIKKVIKNAHEAVAILKKNKWSYSSLESAANSLENALAMGQKKLMGYVDGVGHTMHMALANLLAKEGTYGGCSTAKGDIENINAGNLAYCEGVLKGTSAELTKSGNLAVHKVPPITYNAFILDEDPKGGYHVTLTLPAADVWSNELKTFLIEHTDFKCSGTKCTAYIKKLDDIRELALLLSNLRGASEAIGDKCIPKAIELAQETAKQQNEKGVFAFTQEPFMASPKAWIDLCFKKYGITPPGLTEEDKKVLETVGAEKEYCGCTFAETDTLPSKGILIYCEGIRKNPKGDISAKLLDSGELVHFFHDELDNLAIVNITPLGADKYQVELKNIDMRGDALQDAVIQQLKYLGFTCPTHNNCSSELSEQAVRNLAVFLSSLHQAYKPQVNAKAAVTYVISKMLDLPQDKSVHDVEVYPFELSEWLKELGVAPPEKVVEEKPAVTTWKGWGPIPKPPFKYAGCTSITKAKPTEVKKTYCQGVVGVMTSEGKDYDLQPAGHLPKTAALLTAKENKHLVGGPIVLFDSKWAELTITLPPELAKITPLVETLKKHPYNMTPIGNNQFKRHWATYNANVIARLLSYCSGIHTLPEWCWEAAVKYASEKAGSPGQPPIYPFAEKDWMDEVCAKAKPPEVKWKLKPSELEEAILKFLKPGSPIEWHSFQEIMAWLQEHYDVTEQEILDAGFKLQQEGKITSSAMGWKLVEKPELTPEEVKADVLWYFQKVVAGEKAEYEDLVKHITKMFPTVKSGPAEVEGTIAWAVDALTKEGKLVYYGGTTWGLPKKKPTTTTGDLAVYLLQTLFTPQPDKWIGVTETTEWAQKTYDTDIPQVHSALGKLVTEGKIIAEVPKGYKLKEIKPSIDELILKQAKVVTDLYNKLTDEHKKKMAETTEYKKLPKPVKDWLHAIINQRLLEGQKFGTPYEEIIKELQHAIIETDIPIPITPLMVKLQADIEKKSKIRRGELPPEPGEKVAKTYEEVDDETKAEIYELVKDDVFHGFDQKQILTHIKEAFGIEESFGLNQIISGELLVEPTKIEDLPDEEQEKIIKLIESSYALGLTADMVTKEILKDHPTLFEGTLYDYIVKKMGQLAVKPKYYEDMSPDKQKEVSEYIKDKVKEGGLTGWSILADVETDFNLEDSSDLTNLILHLAGISDLNDVVPTEEVYLHYSEFPKEKQLEITKEILEQVQAGKFADEVKSSLELSFPELEWDEEIESIVKTTIAEWEAEVGKEKPIYYEDLSYKKQEEIKAIVFNQAKQGVEKNTIQANIQVSFGVWPSDKLTEVIEKTTALFLPPVSAVAEAINIIKEGKSYAGCHPDYPGVELSPVQAVYCEGILTPPGKKKAGYVQLKGKTSIISQYGDGYNVVVTSKEANTLALLFKDMEKTGKEWKKRQMSVAKKLTHDLGYTCALLNDEVACEQSGLNVEVGDSKDVVRTTALFMSKLHDIDNLGTYCVDHAVRDALEDAKDLNKNLGSQAYKNPVYPFTQTEWNDKVCSQIQITPKRVDAKSLAQQLGTTGLLDAAHKMGVDPSGSDEFLAKKLLDAGYIGGV